jgi:uncharacterized protein YjfI (DUF2170 family)
MIHKSKLQVLMERVDKHHKRVLFSIVYVKENGEKIIINSAVCTSTFNENDTANIKLLPSHEVRTVSIMGIIRFNDEEVFV